jgi:hypothetical protein
MPNDTQTGLRLPVDLLKRVDEVTDALNRDPETALRGGMSRSDVMRLALVRGLEAIEKQSKNKRKAG